MDQLQVEKYSSQDYCKNLGYTYLDTGAMYRSATYIALTHGYTGKEVALYFRGIS